MSFVEEFRIALKWWVSKQPRGDQAKLANKIHISSQYMSHIISGRKPGSEEVRRKIAEALGYQYEHMLAIGRAIIAGEDPEKIPITGSLGGELPIIKGEITATQTPKDEPPTLPKIPVISWVQAGDWTGIVDEFQPGNADEWDYAASKVGANTFALRVVGDSMEPEFREGEIIIIDPTVEPMSGKYVIAKNGDEEATFKQLFIDGSRTYLRPLNDRYPVRDVTGKEVKIVGVVVQKTKGY